MFKLEVMKIEEVSRKKTLRSVKKATSRNTIHILD